MTVTASARIGLTRWSDESDPDTREQHDADNGLLDELAALYLEGADAGRPAAAGTYGVIHAATDDQRLRINVAGEWRELLLAHRYIGADTGAPSFSIGADAAADYDDLGELWAGRFQISSDLGEAPALYLRSSTAATSAPTIRTVAVDAGDVVERFRVDGDGAIRAGRRSGASGDYVIPRAGYLTVRPTSTAERAVVIDAAATTSDLLAARVNGTRRFSVDGKGRLYLSALSDNDTPATPGGAGVIYCNTVGDLLYKSPSGTVRTLALH